MLVLSLFVNDIVKNSRYKKSTFVFGSMDFKKPFLKRYINIRLNKNILQSTSKSYVKEFLKRKINRLRYY